MSNKEEITREIEVKQKADTIKLETGDQLVIYYDDRSRTEHEQWLKYRNIIDHHIKYDGFNDYFVKLEYQETARIPRDRVISIQTEYLDVQTFSDSKKVDVNQ